MSASTEALKEFQRLIHENRYNFVKLAYIIFPFGEKGHELEFAEPYDWQIEEWRKLSVHLQNPMTRYQTYRLIISSGNGAAKTSFGAMTYLMLMYTQRVRGRITANTEPQMTSIVWPEYDIWCNRARHFDLFFEKFGKSIKAKDPKVENVWRLDAVTWSEQSPQAMSGLHNKGYCVLYIFEEAPGIPANIWQYAAGAFTETETIKIHMAFGNSDDPESKFEQNMSSSLWHALRIDTRTLKHIDPQQIKDWLTEAGGDEDNDDFRVRVRGLPRKSAKDSIIKVESVNAAIARAKDFDIASVALFPIIIGCDPAWTGGDYTTIWYRQGHYAKLLDKYKLDRDAGQDHRYTYNRICHFERELGADAVEVDAGEGTAIITLANGDEKTSWELVNFAQAADDAAEFKDSQYANKRAQMYYETNTWLQKMAVLDAEKAEWFDDIRKQLCWTKGGRHKIHGKKLAEPKAEIKKRVGMSPDVADGLVLTHARIVLERLPQNLGSGWREDRLRTGGGAYRMPDHELPYDAVDADYQRLYD